MKKIAILYAFIFLFFSCNLNNWDDSIIENNSDFPVTFKFSNTSQMDLNIGENVTFPTKAYQYLEAYDPDKRVEFSYSSTDDGYYGEFRTRKKYEIRIVNLTGLNGTLKDNNGWMENINFVSSSGEQTGGSWFIYTFKPNFSAIVGDGYLASVLYQYDDEEDIFKVSIK